MLWGSERATVEVWLWVLCFFTLLGNDAHGLLFEMVLGKVVL